MIPLEAGTLPRCTRKEASMRSRAGCFVLALSFLTAGTLHAASTPSFEDLLSNLKSPTAKTRQEAAEGLGKSRRREAVAPLSALLRDPDDKVRLEMVRALRQLRDVSAVPTLVTAMTDGEPKIREEAIGSLVELYSEQERTGPVDRFLEIFSDDYDRSADLTFSKVDPSVFHALGSALKDDDKNVRSDAAYALGILNGVSEIRLLEASLQDLDSGVRGAAVTALGKIGTTAQGKALIPLLQDDSTVVRNRTLHAIGVLRVKEAGPALRDLYENNKHKDFGLKVLACLSKVADPAQGDLFRELVRDPDPEKKRFAVEGLGRISDASMLPAFKKDYQREHNDELRLAYSFALTLLGDRAFLDTIVLTLPSKTLGTRCRDYVLEMGHGILPDLYGYLNDPDAEIRAKLCDILGIVGDQESLARLHPLMDDPSSKVADRANRASERLKRRLAGG
jgi:HEAT repeat protein